MEAQRAHQAEHGDDMAVGEGAHDIEGLVQVGDGGAALQEGLEALDEGGGPLREIGEGAFLDLAGLAVGLAKQHRGWGVAVGDGFDIHGYL